MKYKNQTIFFNESSQETVKYQHLIRKNIYTIKKANIKVEFFYINSETKTFN